MRTNTPIDFDIVRKNIEMSGLKEVGKASIREIKKLIDNITKETGQEYIRMEMGIPGLPATQIGIEAEKAALDNGVASIYPDVHGIPQLKAEISRFVKSFLDISVNPESCIPTVGSMQGSFACFMTINRMHQEREGTLFLDPGFPVHKQQLRVLGQQYMSFDVYNYRGEKLRDKLESYLSTGKVSSILYSNPNNPSWICFTDQELRIIGELANKYNVIVIEDLAYVGMDFRKDYSQPGVPPFQPTVAKYTENFVLLISSSKAFSYAGQRIGMMVISDSVFNAEAPDLLRYYHNKKVGYAMIFGTMYTLSSGVCHSAQYALAAMLKAANDGEFNFIEQVREYGEKANIMKRLFTENGFKIVYDADDGVPIADGFYFTISYPGFSGAELIEAFLYYGISAISLEITGSERTEGLRACVSLIRREQFPELESRLQRFHEHHPTN
jgi:aspartate/methionine/tyrosine aminotransferase